MASLIFPAINAVAAAAMAIFVYSRNRAHAANRFLALFLLSVALLEGSACVQLWRDSFPAGVVSDRFLLTLLVFTMVSAVFFANVFGREVTGGADKRGYALGLYGMAAAAALIFSWTSDLTVSLADDTSVSAVVFSASWRPIFAFTALSMFIVMLQMVMLRRRVQGIRKQVYHYASMAIASAALFFFMESVMAYALLSLPIDLLNANSVAFAAYQLLFLFTMIRYRLLDIDLFPERNFTHRIFVISIAVTYVCLVALMTYFGWHVMGNFNKYLMGGIALAASAGAVVALASDRLGPGLPKLRSSAPIAEPHKYEYRERWDSFTLLLSHIDDLAGLCRVILPEIMETVRMKKGTLWLLDEEEGCYKCRSAEGLASPQECIEADGILLKALAGEAGPVTAVSLGRLLGPAEVAFLDSIAADVCAPLKVKEKMVGFLTLGAAWRDISRGFEDYRMLRTLAAQTAVALYRQLLAEKLATLRGLESLNRISSFVMHDLKNAVNMLSMVVQNAASNIHKPEFQQDALMTITKSTSKIRGIVERLSFSPEKEKKQRRSVLDLNPAIDAALGRLQLEKVPGVSVTREYGDIPALVAVPQMIDQLLENLLLNAVQSLPSSGGEVSVRTARQDYGRVLLEVSDTGCGMEPSFVAEKLFKPLQTTKEKGLGIGLYHCRHIVTAHGGRIEADSRPNRGSTFRVFFRPGGQNVESLVQGREVR